MFCTLNPARSNLSHLTITNNSLPSATPLQVLKYQPIGFNLSNLPVPPALDHHHSLRTTLERSGNSPTIKKCDKHYLARSRSRVPSHQRLRTVILHLADVGEISEDTDTVVVRRQSLGDEIPSLKWSVSRCNQLTWLHSGE